MEIVTEAGIPAQPEGYAGEVRSGIVDRQWFFRKTTDEGLSFRLFRSHYKPGGDAFESPRHHHGFQQIRWTQSGAVNFAPGKDIDAGDIAYFPRGAYYGPQRKANGVGLLLQYGFGNEMPKRNAAPANQDMPDREAEARRMRLSARENLPGETASVAVIEQDDPGVSDGPVGIPPEIYDAPILMHPRASAYWQSAPGVEFRHLGCFFDQGGPHGDVQITMIRLSDNGRFVLTPERAQVGWTISPGLIADGEQRSAMTCLFSPIGDAGVLEGVDGVEIFLITFPRLA